MNAPVLRPCRFCNSRNLRIDPQQVVCLECGATGPSGVDGEQVTLWNRPSKLEASDA